MKKITALFMVFILVFTSVNVYADGAYESDYKTQFVDEFNAETDKLKEKIDKGPADAFVSAASIEVKKLMASNDTVYIASSADLKNMDGAVGKYFMFTDDIDISKEAWTPISVKDCIIDGRGCVVKGLTISNMSSDYAGLFSTIDGSYITNLDLENVNIDVNISAAKNKKYYVSTMAADASNGSINNCGIDGDINVDFSSAYTDSAVYVNALSRGSDCRTDVPIRLTTSGTFFAYGLDSCHGCSGKGKLNITCNEKYEINRSTAAAVNESESTSYKGDIEYKNTSDIDGYYAYSPANIYGISGDNVRSCYFEGNIDAYSPKSNIILTGIYHGKDSIMKGRISAETRGWAAVAGIEGRASYSPLPAPENNYIEGDINVKCAPGYDNPKALSNCDGCKRKGDFTAEFHLYGGAYLIPVGLFNYTYDCINVGDAYISGNDYSTIGGVFNGSGNCWNGDVYAEVVGNYYYSMILLNTDAEDNYHNGALTANLQGNVCSVSGNLQEFSLFRCPVVGIRTMPVSQYLYSCPYSLTNEENIESPHSDNHVISLRHCRTGKPGDVREPENYALRVVDEVSEMPLADVTVALDNAEYVSDENGIVEIEDDDGYIEELAVKDENKEVICSQEDVMLNDTEVKDVKVPAFDMDVDDLKLGNAGNDTIMGPQINILGKTFSLFQLPFSFQPKVFDALSIAYDADEKTYQAILKIKRDIPVGKEEAQQKGDKKKVGDAKTPEWKKTYNAYKEAYKSKDPKKMKKLFGSKNGGFGFEGDVSGGAFLKGGFNDAGKFEFKEGGVVIALSAEGEYSWPFPPAPAIFLCIGLSGEAGLDASIDLVKATGPDHEFEVVGNTDLAAAIAMSIGAGLRSLLSADIGLEGGIDGSLKIPVKSLQESAEAYLTASGFLRWAAGIFGDKYELNFAKFKLYPKKDTKAISLFDEIAGEEGTKGKLIQRDYLPDIMPVALEPDVFKPAVYPHGKLETMRLSDGRTLMVWLDDDTSRNLVNKTAIYYSVYSDGSWSQPQQTDNDGTADFDFSLCRYEDAVYMVWQNCRQELDDNADNDIVAKNIDLCLAKFENGSWSAPYAVTGNGNEDYEYMPAVNVYQKGYSAPNVIVGWVTNSKNSMLPDEDAVYSIYKSEIDLSFDSADTVTVASDIPSVCELSIGQFGNTVYTVEENNETKLVTDKKMTDLQLGDVHGLHLVNGRDLCYTSENTLFSSKGMVSDKKFASDKIMYICSDSGEEKAAVFEVPDGLTSDLYASRYAGNFYTDWTEPQKITDFGKKIHSWDAEIDDDGSIKISAIITDLSDESGRSDIVSFDTKLKDDTILEYADIMTESIERGKDAEITMEVSNGTQSAVESWDVLVSGEKSGTLYSGRVNNTVNAGNTGLISAYFDIPSDFVKQNVNVTVTPADMTEDDLTNNTQSLEMGEANISFEADESRIKDNKAVFVLKNTGFEDAGNISISIKDDAGNVLLTKTEDALKAGSEQSFEVNIPDSCLSFENIYDHHAVIAYVDVDMGGYTMDYSDSIGLDAQTVEYITSDYSSVAMKPGDTLDPNITLYPENAEVKLYGLSSNKNVAKVDEDNLISAVAPGSAVITYVPLGSDCSCKINVTVVDKGDVDCDGDVDRNDAAMLLRYCSGLEEFDENQIYAGDYNNDGEIDISDTVALLKAVS